MLRGEVAIITGAGSGIGRESAILFAREGAKVVIADTAEEAGLETADLIGQDAFFVKVDVSNWGDMERLVSETVRRFGRLDILFNNAGMGLPLATTVAETNESDWDRIISVNLKGVFLGARHALPVMMTQCQGAIVNTASIAGMVGVPRLAAYCASKGGVVSLTRQLAVDYAPYNIRVNCICPGALEKPMGRGRSSDELEQRRKRLLPEIPLGRLCSASDVAHAALYLASDESAHVTGMALILDGGELAL
jgi:NAD(P)-dependent dehydrogenase (short-subunit alcohol dehydrogenase family)